MQTVHSLGVKSKLSGVISLVKSHHSMYLHLHFPISDRKPLATGVIGSLFRSKNEVCTYTFPPLLERKIE